MTNPSHLAYGYARVRARKSRLLPSAVLAALATADQPALTVGAWRDLDEESDAAALASIVYARLVSDYVVAIRAYPAAADLLRALARLHEVENVKLAWRAVTGAVPAREWRECWRPLGPLERVARAACETAGSLRQLAAVMRRTPFAVIAAAVLDAHGEDLAAAEVAFDRWGSSAVVDAARALPRAESAARDLAFHVVRERDVMLMARAVGPLGLAPEAALRMTAVMAAESGPARMRRLVEHLADRSPSLTDLRRQVRVARRLACRRAFLGNPFCLAPPIALVMLREDEARALFTVAELRARRLQAAAAARLLNLDG
ncbi:MAG: V0D/AC39 family V-type ATPase subunit [Vicinamibacterales bacterium]